MVGCAVDGCNSRTERYEARITFHRFPINQQRKRIWARNMKIVDRIPTSNDRICSRHFEKKWFYTIGSRVRLLDDAIPTIFSPPQQNTYSNKGRKNCYIVAQKSSTSPSTVKCSPSMPLSESDSTANEKSNHPSSIIGHIVFIPVTDNDCAIINDFAQIPYTREHISSKKAPDTNINEESISSSCEMESIGSTSACESVTTLDETSTSSSYSSNTESDEPAQAESLSMVLLKRKLFRVVNKSQDKCQRIRKLSRSLKQHQMRITSLRKEMKDLTRKKISLENIFIENANKFTEQILERRRNRALKEQ